MQLVLFSHHSTRVHALLHTNVKHGTSETRTPQDCLITQVPLPGVRIGRGMMVNVSPYGAHYVLETPQH